jgi:hypothetical protein
MCAFKWKIASNVSIALIATAALLLSSGCSDGLATVEGKVTFNGEAVNRGMISLEPIDGKGPSSGGSIESGQFKIDGVTPGEKIVHISAVYVKGVQKQEEGGEIEICEDLLPKEYGRGSKTKLTVTAPATKQDYPIEGPDPRKTQKAKN